MGTVKSNNPRWWVVAGAIVLGWILALTGCVQKPWMVRQFAPLPVYKQWYSEVETCLQRKGNYHQVRWWIMSDSLAYSGHLLGYWVSPNDILLRISHVGNQVTVKHETIHQILGFGGHFAPYPFGQCDGDSLAAKYYPHTHTP